MPGAAFPPTVYQNFTQHIACLRRKSFAAAEDLAELKNFNNISSDWVATVLYDPDHNLTRKLAKQGGEFLALVTGYPVSKQFHIFAIK